MSLIRIILFIFCCLALGRIYWIAFHASQYANSDILRYYLVFTISLILLLEGQFCSFAVPESDSKE